MGDYWIEYIFITKYILSLTVFKKKFRSIKWVFGLKIVEKGAVAKETKV